MTTGHAAGKLNLYLKVVRKREDGFHDLESLFVALASPYDEVTLRDTPGKPFSFRCSGSDQAPDSQDNLAARAAREFARAAGIAPEWSVELVKHLPVAAGMGGGSSDAGCVLRMLQKSCRTKLAPEQLLRTAKNLGADVPYFLHPRHAEVRGTGDLFTPVPGLPALPVLLVNPGFPIRAAWSYRRLDPAAVGPDREARLPKLLEALRRRDIAQVGSLLHNDLAAACFAKFPLLGELMDELAPLGAAGMTGSGPTLFVLSDDRAKLADAAAALRRRYAGTPIWIELAALADERENLSC